jgi:hypothetical protein
MRSQKKYNIFLLLSIIIKLVHRNASEDKNGNFVAREQPPQVIDHKKDEDEKRSHSTIFSYFYFYIKDYTL